MSIEAPYVLFLGRAQSDLDAKTAVGIAHWRGEKCIGQVRLEGCQLDLGLGDVDIEGAARNGAKTLVLGVVNRGGVLDPAWVELLERALAAGMDLASGMHMRLADNARLAEAARKHGRQLHDVRHPTQSFAVGSGEPRTGKRVLSVGTDCSVGKMYTTMALDHDMRQAGMKADFRATGQTGILVSGEGVSVDAVVADFIAGAAEWLAPENDADHWDVVEGQGSLFHPSFAGVSLGLLHGSQPDALVMCHEPTREHMRGLPNRSLPDIGETIRVNEQMAHLVNPAAQVIGLAVNTAAMGAGEADSYLKELAERHNMPAVDPVRHGTQPLVERLKAI